MTGQVVVADPTLPWLPRLTGQLVALQVEDALALGRPENAVGYEDLHKPSKPPVEPVRYQPPDLSEVARRVYWRSAYDELQRWEVEATTEDRVVFLAPQGLGELVRSLEGELIGSHRRVTVANAVHPRRGRGILLQATLGPQLREQAVHYRNWAILTQAGRWYGTGLGGLRLWDGDGDGDLELVYHAFLPFDLLGMLEPSDALEFVVDAVLASVNLASVAEAMITVLEAGEGDEPEKLRNDLDDKEQWIRGRYRLSALRAATHVQAREDGLADTEGPMVEVGRATLDWLAVDQLHIETAPAEIWDDGFAWLPGPYVQEVKASPMRPSRGTEVTDISVMTDLGLVVEESRAKTAAVCVELMESLPLCSLVITDEGRLQLVSRALLHEGVWWHRRVLLSVMAALQLNCAEVVRGALEAQAIETEVGSALRERLAAQGAPAGFDPIYDVIPYLRDHHHKRAQAADVVAMTGSLLLERPGSHLFGELDDVPDVTMEVRGLHDDGGWDPPIGIALVELKTIEHELAGECIKVTLNPGWLPGHSDLVAQALRLTALTYKNAGALSPSWVVREPTVCATIVLPRSAVATGELDQEAEIVLQAVRSCLISLAEAVTSSDRIFPGFDRSQVNLTRAKPAGLTGWPLSGTVVWAPVQSARVIAVRQEGGDPEHWFITDLSLDASDALRNWLMGKVGALFFVDKGTTLSVWRAEEGGFVLKDCGHEAWLPARAVPALCGQLEHPEGPLTGQVPGQVVAYAIGVVDDGEGNPVFVLPPAGGLTAVMGAEDVVCDGPVAVTTSSLWLRFSSQARAFHLEVPQEIAEQMVATEPADGQVQFSVRFPFVDARVASPPPGPWTGSVEAKRLRWALAEIQGPG